MIHPRHIALILFTLTLCVHAQVRVDRVLDLNGTDAADRQVIGLHDASDPGDALNARSLQRGAYRYAEVAGGSTWQADVQPAVTQVQAGFCLLLRSNDGNTGAVTVSVNGSSPIPVLKEGDQPLVAGDVTAGETVTLIHDGVAFQLVGSRRLERRPCPGGTVVVNDLYCIETQEHDTVEFPAAAVACASAGMQLCTWGQWYAACVNATTLGLQSMTGNWEWTNSAANSDTQVRVVGQSTCTHAATTNGWGSVQRNFRCCFRR